MAREPDCNEVVELVTAYLEGELKRRDRKAFERHLKKCEGCASYLEQVRITIKAVGRVEGDELPEQLREGLLAAFRDWRSA